ncbi:MAG: discoidin domain-containing protein, partial [Bacteroidota bacterium]|nr:discoidin domain-containing protein [Bacteroidota bacterium]
EYTIFPRMAALSEVDWTPKEKKDWNNFQAKLPAMLTRYQLWNANYSKASFDLQSSVLPSENYNGIFWKLENKNPDSKIIYVKGKTTNASFDYTQPIFINAPGFYGAAVAGESHKIISSWIWKTFYFNKATGKKIVLKSEPAANYPGSGAFTLVDGIISENGLSESSEWLGFSGKDLEANIDLDEPTKIKSVSLNVLDQTESWIYLPKEIQVATSYNGENYSSIATLAVDVIKDKGKSKFTIPVNTTTRYIKVLAQNAGTIPFGAPGAGSQAWLFVDEIEIN